MYREALPKTGISILTRKEVTKLKNTLGRYLGFVGSIKVRLYKISLYFSVGIHLHCLPSDIEG